MYSSLNACTIYVPCYNSCSTAVTTKIVLKFAVSCPTCKDMIENHVVVVVLYHVDAWYSLNFGLVNNILLL